MQRHGFESPHPSPGAEARDGVETRGDDPPEEPREHIIMVGGRQARGEA